MTIETERLRIMPLFLSQLHKYVASDGSLEAELNLNPSPRDMSPDLAEAFETSILPNMADPKKNYWYYTLWTIIAKTENKMVGGLLFTGEPNAEGEVEIGYGTEPPFQNKGYMTEAIGGIVQWLKGQSHVRTVLAQTDLSNVPSYKTLIKNNFAQYKTVEDKIWWRLPIV